MGYYTTFKVLETSDKMSYNQLDDIVNHLEKLEGVTLINWNPKQFEIEYYPDVYSITFLKDELEKIGIPLKKGKKNFMGRFLNRISQENQESFGKGKLDCCNLNGPKRSK